MQVKRVTDAVGYSLNDLEVGYEHTRWPLVELIEYLLQALSQITALKPELLATSTNMALAPGERQTVPDGIAKLLDITANTDAAGGFISNVVKSNYNLTRHFPLSTCRLSDPAVASYTVDPNNPRVFYVKPAASAYPQQYVTVLGQSTFADNIVAGGTIRFTGGDAETYSTAMVDYMLYRAFSKDTESTTSLQRAQMHLKEFNTFMRTKMQADAYNESRSTPTRKGNDEAA